MRRPFVKGAGRAARAPSPEAVAAAIQRRTRRATVAVGLAGLVLLLRLWQLQVLEGDRYWAQSQNNRLRVRPIEAPRGFILDRHGVAIVENRPSFDLYAVPADVRDAREVARVAGEILGQPAQELAARLEAGLERPHEPLLLQRGLDMSTVVAVEERKQDLLGLSLRIRPVRAYPEGGLASNLLGYVGEVTAAQLRRDEYRGFRPGSLVGQGGVEKRLDPLIRGRDGGDQVEVDARGRVIRVLSRIDPRSGLNVYLTLDRRIQAAAEEAFEGKRGAAIVLNPQTGEILALVSRPTYDPNLFARRLTADEWRQLAGDPGHPLQNKALQAQYPPGSLFKLVTAIAGLESGALTAHTTFFCPGSFRLGSFEFADWKKGGHGAQNLTQAIANSCNVYFYQAALRVGIREIDRVARAFGLGAPSRLGLGDEAPGLLPSPEVKFRLLREPWYPGDTVISGIGQGLIAVTPIQVGRLVAAIGNGGLLYRPQAVHHVESLAGEVSERFRPEVERRVEVRPETLALIRRAMWESVNRGGTGGRARVEGFEVAGKTATAQVVRRTRARPSAPTGAKDHAWFAAVAPAEEPRVAVVVLVEHGGFGGQAAAPVARTILAQTFRLLKGAAPPPTPRADEPPDEEVGD